MNLHKHSTRSLRKPCRNCGKADGLYWAHDLDNPDSYECRDCEVSGKFVMVESVNSDPRQYRIHDCRDRYAGHPIKSHVWTAEAVPAEPRPVGFTSAKATVATMDASPLDSAEPVSITPMPAPRPAGNGQPGDRMEMLNALLDLLAPKVDAAQVRDILRQENDTLISELTGAIESRLAQVSVPTQVTVTLPDASTKDIGTCHAQLPEIIKVAKFRHVLMVGPAGSGKSHIPAQVAEAYGCPYYEMSVGPQVTKTDLFGYKDGNGEYHRTLFREWFEFGGVFHFDELDAGLPGIIMMINGALAQPQIAFPDGMVKRHDGFMRAIASANTYGRGADRVYQGRQPLDQSTLNRFAVIPLGYDHAFEQALCEATGAQSSTVTAVLAYVRSLRATAERESMPVILSMRDSVGMCELLAEGMSPDRVTDLLARRGLSDADWRKLTASTSALSV